MDDEARFFLTAFVELSSSRPAAFAGVAPIPWTAIAEYARVHELSDFDDFNAIIRAVDTGYISAVNEEREREEGMRSLNRQ